MRQAGSADSAVAWLAVAAPTASRSRVPLTAASCLSLARLLLAPLDPDRGTAGSVSLAAGFRLLGGAAAEVAEWLDVVAAAGDGGERSAPLVAALQAALFVPHPAAAEAAVLADAMTAASARDAATARFAEAVAAARIEALREFAYGAGHEINNPLANIATRAQALLIDEDDPERRRRLATIVDQAFRARDMIGGLMVFARPPKPRPATVSIAELLHDVIEAVRALAGSRGVRLEHAPGPPGLSVHVDASLVTEALRLLVVNAIEGAVGGGLVGLDATVSLGPDGGCRVTVRDDGAGMTPEVLRRAFDPFASGREAGRGLGLGLPKAWRLLEINGCRLTVESQPRRGTRLVVTMPDAVTPSMLQPAS